MSLPLIVTENKGMLQPVKFLGQGSYGAVFLYYSPSIATYYICKFYYPVPKKLKTIEHELEIMDKIYDLLNGCQPYIICYVDKIQLFPSSSSNGDYGNLFSILSVLNTKDVLDPSTPIYGNISQYVAGYELSYYVFYSEMDCFVFLKQIFFTLDQLHSKDMIHSDIKPENIIFNTENQLFVLIDFGLACLQNACHTSPVRGTYFYTPNKLLTLGLNLSSVTLNDRKFQDVYGIMVSVYKLVNKRHPYQHIPRPNQVGKYLNDENTYQVSTSPFPSINILLDYFFFSYLNYDYHLVANFFTAANWLIYLDALPWQ